MSAVMSTAVKDQGSSGLSTSSSERSYRGCSTIEDYDLLRKLGEGTFGYVAVYGEKRV